MTSLWLDDAQVPARLRLTPGSRFDTVVIGGGITGLATALLLAESGVQVAVLEGRRVGAGTTGASTGKVSLLQGTRAQRIRRRHGDETLRAYIDANRAGQQWLMRYCEERTVPVQHEAALTYAQSKAEISAVRREFEAAQAVGMPVDLLGEIATPFPSYGAVRLEDQAQLDPMALLAALAVDIEGHAASIFESTLARNVRSGKNNDLIIETEHGDLIARTVVIATGTPILDRGGFFTRLTAQRSYLTAFAVTEPVPHEMFLSAGSPTRSLRYTPSPDGDVLLVGGNDHTVGREPAPRLRTEEMIEWTRTWCPTAEPLHSWSAQDYLPVDELPYVGPLLPGRDNILVATGYAKWGLTNGVAAALAIAGRVTGKPPAWARTFASWRPRSCGHFPPLSPPMCLSHTGCCPAGVARPVPLRPRCPRKAAAESNATASFPPRSARWTGRPPRYRRSAPIWAASWPGTMPSAPGTARCTVPDSRRTAPRSKDPQPARSSSSCSRTPAHSSPSCERGRPASEGKMIPRER